MTTDQMDGDDYYNIMAINNNTQNGSSRFEIWRVHSKLSTPPDHLKQQNRKINHCNYSSCCMTETAIPQIITAA